MGHALGHRWYFILGTLALVGLLAACGGSGGTSSTISLAAYDPVADDSEVQPAGVTTVAVVKVMPTPELGRVLVDSGGMTVYDSHGDNPMLYQFNRPPTPSCYKACAMVWRPVLTAAAPKAMGGADVDLLGTIRREDGSRQVTYAGHPLYTYAGDKRPGETNGDYTVSFGEAWHALEPDGEEPADEGSGGD